MAKYSLLLIDDDEDQLAVLGAFLEQRGYKVQAFRRAQEALTAIKEAPIDCVICDVMMPEMSGKDLVNRLRSEAVSVDVPIIMLTAAREDLAPELLSIGADEFCLKRDIKRNLVPLIESVLKQGSGSAKG
jgi:two-component system phosphate regulon response regulator PhoB